MLKKIVSVLLMVLVLVTGSLTTHAATSASDYTALKYAKIEELGNNTVRIYGNGFMGHTVQQGTASASAILYKYPVKADNLSFDIEFIKDYGNGEGLQSGWYAFNISKTPAWFTSVKNVIKAEDISGVNIIFKLDTADKKKVYIELSRYSAGSGFNPIFASRIETDINEAWKCHVEMKNNALFVDGKHILDLTDAITIALGGTNTGYLGWGGFSESNHPIEMKVTFDGGTRVNTGNSGTIDPGQGGTDTNTGNQGTSKPNTETSKPSLETNTETSNPGTETTPDEVKPDETTPDATNPGETDVTTDVTDETDKDTTGAEESKTETKDTDKTVSNPKSTTSPLIIVLAIVLALVVIACGVVGVLLIKKRRG